MKKVLGLSLGTAFVVLILFVMGFGGSQKIGLVDVSGIISESDAGKDASAKLQGFIETKEAEVRERRDDLVRLQEALNKEKEGLSEAQLQDKTEELAQETRDYRQFVADVRQEVRTKDKSLSEKLLPEIRKIVRGIGHKEGYTVIMDINTGEIIYHTTDAEITDRVLKRFNEQYNTGALDISETSGE